MSLHQRSPVATLLLAGGAIGPALFVVAFALEGAVRPGYSAWHNFVSDLSEGPDGWIQVASFLVCGALVVGFALGLWLMAPADRSRLGTILLGVFGLALIVAGVFVTDPSLGYDPPGFPAGLQTVHGTIHGTDALLVFGSLTAAIVLQARAFARGATSGRWARYSFMTAVVIAATFVACLAAAVLDEDGVLPNAPVGLLERFAIVAGWGWIAAFALRTLSSHARPSAVVEPNGAP